MDIIPAKFGHLLHGLSDDVSAAVGSTLTRVKPILERNEAPFFPDYTDHGIGHVKSVLSTSELLVGDEAWSVFTREDAAVLVLATMAHDLGMLIDIEGFRFLLDTNLDDTLFLESNDQPWEKLWREFQLEVRRFDGTTLVNILGSQDPVSAHEFDLSQLTERGIRVVGEFLRRHHHRLAHEIVLLGLPSGNGRVPLFDNAPKHLREVAGIVARSHGLTLRESVELLTKHDRTGHREYRHIHPAFLMVLVRLADYLDLDIGRAPASILSAKSLRSPISRREWWSHRAIVDCHSYDEDPECLRIVVDPSALPDVATFAVVEDKMVGIQQELDSCWAVLGEIYGRFPPLNRLSLRIRRIRSDFREISKICKLPFVPHRASLKTAQADLLKLLIEPLYGDHPGIGIRELIQNAIDAVRELDFVLQNMPSKTTIDREELEGSVIVQLEIDNRDEYWVTVADQGIGMTWETIQKYYLTAGASFRQSDAWKKRFSNDSESARVLRAGRFGIGILAAFLLGDRVRVLTRHVDEPEDKGIQFEFGIDDTNIEMKWATKKVGTTVKVRTTKSVIERLMDPHPYKGENWDWYCLERPVLVRRDLNGKKVKQKHKLPGLEETLPTHWHRIQAPGFQAIDWSYRLRAWSDRYKDRELVFCNGLLIPNGDLGLESQFNLTESKYNCGRSLYLIDPMVSIFDPDGRLPLNLARDRVASSVGDLDLCLVDDLCRNFIAYCLIKGPQSPMFSETQPQLYLKSSYPGFSEYSYHSYRKQLFFSTPDGFGLSDPWNISHFVSKTGLLIRALRGSFHMSEDIAELIMASYGLTLPIDSNGKLYQFDNWYRKLALTIAGGNEFLDIFRGINVKGMRTLMPAKWYERFITKQAQFVTRLHQIESKTPEWVIITFGDCKNKDSVLGSLADDFLKNRAPVESATEFYLSAENEAPKPGRIAQMWKEVLGKPIIPFDKTRRQAMVEKLNGLFERHLEEWRLLRDVHK